jgi:hypothetical protein
MKHISIDYCALKYLNNYLEFEKEILESYDLKNKKWEHDNFKKFATYFKVARNLEKSTDDDPRYSIICDIINNFKITENNIENVNSLFEKVKVKYDKELVSLCSKALWFKNKEIRIYDSQAKNGLTFLSKKNILNYEEYYNIWNNYYELSKNNIIKSTLKLKEIDNYTLFNNFDKQLLNQTWFNERVFDTYLREIGKNKNKLCIQK